MSTEQVSVVKDKDNVPEKVENLPVFLPPTDVYEQGDTIVIVVDMPGVEESGLDIALENDSLTVTGKQAEAEKAEQHQLLHHGYRTGIYKRSFNILTEIDRDKIKAKLEHGVLTVTLPKSEETKPRKIQIELA